MKKHLTRVISMVLAIGLVGLLMGCDIPVAETSSHEIGQKVTEETVKELVKNDVLPRVTKSLERENIKRRIEFINQPDKIGYVYLLSENGQLIKEVQVLGKVTSLNSYLTPMEEVKVIRHDGDSSRYMETPVTVQAPDLDGSYGENQNGIFWFTPDGVYLFIAVNGLHLRQNRC
jgi:hypothetical protein